VVRKRVATEYATSRSFEFTSDNRVLKLGPKGTKSLMITRSVAIRLLFSPSLLLPGSFFFATFASAKAHPYAGMKTSVHLLEICSFSYLLGAEILLESGRRTKEATVPGQDKGANR
jgi:hypothetical protein